MRECLQVALWLRGFAAWSRLSGFAALWRDNFAGPCSPYAGTLLQRPEVTSPSIGPRILKEGFKAGSGINGMSIESRNKKIRVEHVLETDETMRRVWAFHCSLCMLKYLDQRPCWLVRRRHLLWKYRTGPRDRSPINRKTGKPLSLQNLGSNSARAVETILFWGISDQETKWKAVTWIADSTLRSCCLPQARLNRRCLDGIE